MELMITGGIVLLMAIQLFIYVLSARSSLKSAQRELEYKMQLFEKESQERWNNQKQALEYNKWSATRQLEDEIQQAREKASKQLHDEMNERRELEIAMLDNIVGKYKLATMESIESISREFFEKKRQVESVINSMTEEAEDIASRYVQLVETERVLLLEKDQLKARQIQLSTEDQEDINLLLKEIVPRIRRPDVLRKLIWTEYVQKLANDMLNNVVPQDCSGIYKITHLPDKKCYIGRAVSVRKRLTEHVKSSLGVGTIADQAVHHAMRDNGLHNFIFELVEECDKDKLPEREKFYINFFQQQNWGYNKNVGG